MKNSICEACKGYKLSIYETMLIEILRMKLKEIKFDNGIDKTNQWPKKKKLRTVVQIVKRVLMNNVFYNSFCIVKQWCVLVY